MAFKGASQEDQVVCKQGRGAQSYHRFEPKHTEVSLLYCSGLGTGSERGEALLTANASMSMEMLVCFNDLLCHSSAGFNINPCVSLTTYCKDVSNKYNGCIHTEIWQFTIGDYVILYVKFCQLDT